jgi:hypothetical protein
MSHCLIVSAKLFFKIKSDVWLKKNGQVATRVARRYFFKPKIPIWVNFGGPWNGKCWSILWPFGIYYGNSVYFMAIWWVSCNLVYFPLFWYIVSRKIWQPWTSNRPQNSIKLLLVCRDQLSQLLLVYIGTAADIIEFFDSFKVKTIIVF